MTLTKTLKVFALLVLGLALFTSGYFWGSNTKDRSSHAPEGSMVTDAGGTKAMETMAGMQEMAPGMVMVSPDKQQLIGVRTAVIERKPLDKTIRTVGTVTYDETKLTRIHSKIDGWVEKLYVNYTGKLVEKGQPLFTIYSPDLLATQAEYLLALRNHERLLTSSIPELRSGAASLVEASKKRLMLWDISEKQIRDLEERGDPQRTLTLYAPHSGFVIKKDIYEGMRVMPDKELYAIADLSTVWINADIYEYEILLIKVGQQAAVTLPYYPGETFVGQVSYIYPYLEEKTRTAKARLEFPNPGFKLKPEMYVNAEIKARLGEDLVVPQEAVLDSGARKIVFLDRGNGHFEPKEVELGMKTDRYYHVISGLKGGERVAASAAFLLDSESRLKEAMGAMAGMPGMQMEGMKGMKMDMPMKGGPLEKKVQDLTLTLSTKPEKPKAGENVLRLKIADKTGKVVKDAQVSFNFTMAMPGMAPSKTDGKLSKDGFYEAKANLAMAGEWEVGVVVRRADQKEIQEKFKLVTEQ